MKWHSENLETVPCDLCGSTSVRNVFRRDDGLNAVECSECGLCFISPRPKSDLIADLYNETYFGKCNEELLNIGYSNYSRDEKRHILFETAQTRLCVFKEVIETIPKKCLEIGCATGEFCHVIHQEGAVPVGLDISKFVIETARKRYPNLDFREGGIESLKEDEQFDAVFAFEVIEHVLSPKKFLKKIKRILKKDGILVLSTPNLDFTKVTGIENWGGFLTSFEHLYFFSSDTLIRYTDKIKLTTLQWLTDTEISTTGNLFIKQFVKSILAKTYLLNFAKKAKRKLYPHNYKQEGFGSNLFIVLQNVEQSETQTDRRIS